MNFPLWNLPYVPRALVIRQVEPINVIQLSMKSERLKSFLMIFKLFAYKLTLKFGADQGCFYDYNPPDCIHLSIMFNEDDEWNFKKENECSFEFFAQNNAAKQFQKLQTRNLCILYDLGSQALRIQQIQALTQHILDIFYVKKYELGHFIIPGYNSWNNFFLKDQINNFDKVDIDTRRFETWSAVALQELFDNLRTDELWLKIRVDTPGARFKFNKLTHFHLHECDWLSVEDLIEVDSEWYYLSLIEPMDLMKIVMAWKSGKKMENLFELTMDFQGKVSPDNVLQHIDQFGGVRKDEEYGDDARFFKRDTDGQIAFICVAEQYFELSLNKVGCTPYLMNLELLTFHAFLNEPNVLNVTDTLYLYTLGVDTSEDVEYKFASAPKCFILDYARWFTRKTLQSLANCTLIDLCSSRLVHKDVNEFVNFWKSGEFSALEYFQIKLCFEPGLPIGGLTNLKDYSNRIRRIKKIYRHTYDVLEGAVIQGDDGRKADVRLNIWEEKFKLLVHSEKDKFEYVELITID